LKRYKSPGVFQILAEMTHKEDNITFWDPRTYLL